eukprot:gene2660-5220_t
MSYLSDAIGGAVAAGISSIVFYPLEIRRVRAHSEKAKTDIKSSEENVTYNVNYLLSSLSMDNFINTANEMRMQYDKVACLSIGNTMVSSFIYYCLYGKLKNILKDKNTLKLSWISNIIAANLAAVVSVIIMFPIDGVVCRAQVKDDKSTNKDLTSTTEQQVPSSSNVLSLALNLSRFWRGITPALALCLNPTIHYTIYDKLKFFLLMMKMKSSSNNYYSNNDTTAITTMEAFVIGFIAKISATIVSYPLVRAKILLITRSKHEDKEEEGKQEQYCYDDNDNTTTTTTAITLMTSQQICNCFCNGNNGDVEQSDDNSQNFNLDVASSSHDASNLGNNSSNPLPLPIITSTIENNNIEDLEATATSSPSSPSTSCMCCCHHKPSTSTSTSSSSIQLPNSSKPTSIASSSSSSHYNQSDCVRMCRILYMLAIFDGMGGLYQGLSVHILHSSLRGALSMSLKEFIVKKLIALNSLGQFIHRRRNGWI